VHLEWVTLAGFRSYTGVEWRPDRGTNLLVGDNGAGKTNLLEAVSYLATLRSFRGSPDEALVAHESDSAVLRGSVVRDDGDATTLIEIEVRRRGPRRVQVNRQRLGRVADLIGHVRIVAFLPEDLDIVKRGPGYRRDVLDEAAVQLWSGTYSDRMEFERALRQRNAFLKQGDHDPITLSVWDERLAQAAGRVMSRRVKATAAIEGHLTQAYREIAGGHSDVGVDYISSWSTSFDEARPASTFATEMAEALVVSRKADRDRRVTTVGPHRDEPRFLLDGHDARHHASQGEQRTLALAIRLATHRAISDVTDTLPILLLDDVFSELDPKRASALTDALPVTQTLITTADPSHVPVEGTSWKVKDGGIER
jgi:DNA replication and repair protein RecF